MQKDEKDKTHFIEADNPLPPHVQVRRDEKNDTIVFLKGENLSEILEVDEHFRHLQAGDLFDDIALAYITAHRSDFKLLNPGDELTVKTTTTDDLGFKHVKMQQVFKGIPVWASEIIVHLDRSNHVYLVNGRYQPTPVNVKTRPVLSEGEAFRIVAEDLKTVGLDCQGCRSELVIFAMGENRPHLAYRVSVAPHGAEGWAVFVDGESGAILERIPTVIHDGRSAFHSVE